MKKTSIFTKLLSVVVCIVLIAAMGLVLTSCGSEGKSGTLNKPQSTVQNSGSTVQNSGSTDATSSEDPYGGSIANIGSGSVSFIFNVTDKDGYTSLYRIRTDKKMVGDALLEHRLIEGEDGPYGLYVKKVMGITADYDKDQTYWAFYIDGEYAMTGVDKTEIKEGTEYAFVIEK